MMNHPLEESWKTPRNRKRQEQTSRRDARKWQTVIPMCLLAAVLTVAFL